MFRNRRRNFKGLIFGVLLTVFVVSGLFGGSKEPIHAQSADPTMIDFWEGNAEWQLIKNINYNVTSNQDPAWQSSAGTSISVVNGTWYWFRRYAAPNQTYGMQCLKSTNKGVTWSSPVTVIAPQSGTPWAWMVTDGDFYYDQANNKWVALLQTIESPTSGWQACYFERSGSDPMGPFTTPSGFSQPAIHSKEIWSQIANNASDDCVSLAGGQVNSVLDEGTFEIVEKVNNTYTITFHGAFILNGKVHGVRGLAYTNNFQTFTPGANDCIFDEKDTNKWNVVWQGGSVGVGAQSTIKESDGNYYAMIEGADLDLNATNSQQWTWGLYRSNSMSNTNWVNWAPNPVKPLVPTGAKIEWQYVQLYKDSGVTYMAANKAYPISETSTKFYKLIWKTPPTQNIVAIKSMANYNYAQARNGGNLPLRASASWVAGSWEKYEMVDNGDGSVSFKSLANNLYVQAQDGGNLPLKAVSSWVAGSWEKFTIEDAGGGLVAIKSKANNRYVQAQNGGSGDLKAVANGIGGSWEQFIIVPLD